MRQLRTRLITGLPVSVVGRVKRLAAWPSDMMDGVLGRRDPLTPPRGLSMVGAGEFRQVGQEFLGHFVNLAGLAPDERVLDVGCGIGRMAVPLTGYLSARGSYDGFDIVARGVKWCQQAITPQFPRFRFQHADVRNRTYNPGGRVAPEAFRFPFDDASSDLVFLTSVFTHMLPSEVEHYLGEIARVLAPGGRCLATMFLLNEGSLAKGGRAQQLFPHQQGVYRIASDRVPENAVAFDEDWALDAFRHAGLAPRLPVHYGAWSGRTEGASYQDIVVADRG